MGDFLEVIGAEAGMHLVGLLPPGINDMKISEEAAHNGISAMPLSTCCLIPPTRGGLVLGYAGSNVRQINDGVRKLAIILNRHRRC
jgi:GntR family transcriptional regulator/MocR family aminotransferase